MKLIPKLEVDIENLILNTRTLPKQPLEYIEIIFKETNKNDITCGINQSAFPFAISDVKSCEIKAAKILDSNDDKENIEIDLINHDEFMHFLPGDTIGILPENNLDEVDFMLKVLNLSEKGDDSCVVQVKSNTTKKGAKIPAYITSGTTTCRTILTHFLNIRSIPKKVFLCALLEYCEDDKEREFLETLSSKEGSQIYDDLIFKRLINVLDIFRICHSVHPPISLLIEQLPRLMPRPYSIANCYFNNKYEIKIIFSLQLENPGVTTEYLKSKTLNIINNVPNSHHIVNLYFRQPSKFRLTEEYYSKNIIMISIGCGISPFLGFLEHKKYLIGEGLEFGNWYMYSGFKCKSTSIHRDELLQYEKNGVLEKFYECLSREETAIFKYVQDAINETQNQFISMVQDDNTVIFVCADGNQISKDIKTFIQKCVFGNVDKDSNNIMQEWIKNGKYNEDIWN